MEHDTVVLSLLKKISTHLTIDNRNGSQGILIGKGTAQNTDRTLFQPVNLQK